MLDSNIVSKGGCANIETLAGRGGRSCEWCKLKPDKLILYKLPAWDEADNDDWWLFEAESVFLKIHSNYTCTSI